MARMKIFINNIEGNWEGKGLEVSTYGSWGRCAGYSNCQAAPSCPSLSIQSLPANNNIIEGMGAKMRKRQNLDMLQFCVTQSHVEQGAIAKKSSLLSQHETPPQLLNATGRSWSCGFQGTEQRMMGNSSHPFLARAACLPNPLLQDAFKPDNLMFYISAEKLSISTKYTSGYLSVRCGILSTSYFRSRTG